jgi:cell wall-associated NlpC family hydrolase
MLKYRWLLASLTLLINGCASGNLAIPKPFPQVSPRSESRSESGPEPRDKIIGRVPNPANSPGWRVTETALALRGTPYRQGGNDLRGFDCSGFVQYVYGQHGLQLPRNVASLYQRGIHVDRGPLLAGDLIFFSTVTVGASHVGIALGNGNFVHAPSSGGHVRIENLKSNYWGKRYVGARRITTAQ